MSNLSDCDDMNFIYCSIMTSVHKNPHLVRNLIFKNSKFVRLIIDRNLRFMAQSDRSQNKLFLNCCKFPSLCLLFLLTCPPHKVLALIFCLITLHIGKLANEYRHNNAKKTSLLFMLKKGNPLHTSQPTSPQLASYLGEPAFRNLKTTIVKLF